MHTTIWERFEFTPNTPPLEQLGPAIKSVLGESAELKQYPIRGGADNRIIRDCLSILLTDRRQVLIEHPTDATFIDLEVIGLFSDFLSVREVVERQGGKSNYSRRYWIRRQTFRNLYRIAIGLLVLLILATCIWLIWRKGIGMAILILGIVIVLGSIGFTLFVRALKNMH